MSLKNKLENISKELQTQKEKELKITEEEELKPIRAHIKELENIKSQLELIKGSLELKSDKKENTGKGMKEHSEDTDQLVKEKFSKLETLAKEHEGALKAIGVESIDQLMTNPETANEEEVIAHKLAVEQKEKVGLSDKALQEKLKNLGVEIDQEKFSYDLAEKATAEKLLSLDSELLQEKLKTPEGKEEAVENIAKNLEKSLAETLLSKSVNESKFSVGTFGYNGDRNLIITKDKVTFTGWEGMSLLPKNVKDLESEYGKEVTQAGINKAYENKIGKTIKDFDNINGQNFSLAEQLKSISPEEREKARELMKEFSELQKEFRETIKQKSEELKTKKIDFDPIRVTGYGSNYEQHIQLYEYENDREDLRKALGDSKFPPRFDFIKLQNSIIRQKVRLQKFIDVIKKINTTEDVKKFTEYGVEGDKKGNSISGLRMDLGSGKIYDNNFELNSTNEAYQKLGSQSSKKPIEDLSKMGSYYDAKSYIDNNIKELDSIKEKAFEKIELSVDIKFIENKLYEKIREAKIFDIGGLGEVNDKLKGVEKNKENAKRVLEDLMKIKIGLPQDEVLKFEKAEINVPSVAVAIKELEEKHNEDKKKLENDLSEVQSEMVRISMEKYLINGAEKRAEKLKEPERRKPLIEDKLKKLGSAYSTDLNELYKKQNIRIDYRYLDLGSKIEGTAEEIYQELEGRMNKIMNLEVPKEIIELNNKYIELKKKLS